MFKSSARNPFHGKCLFHYLFGYLFSLFFCLIVWLEMKLQIAKLHFSEKRGNQKVNNHLTPKCSSLAPYNIKWQRINKILFNDMQRPLCMIFYAKFAFKNNWFSWIGSLKTNEMYFSIKFYVATYYFNFEKITDRFRLHRKQRWCDMLNSMYVTMFQWQHNTNCPIAAKLTLYLHSCIDY